MRVEFLPTKKETSVGLLLALAHATYVGWCIQVAYETFRLGLTDLDLFFYHQFHFVYLDGPILLMQLYDLPPFGIVPRGDVLAFAIEDATYLALGSVVWFAYGYYITRLFTGGHLSAGFQQLRRRGGWTWHGLRILVLLIVLYSLLRWISLERLRMSTLLYYLKGMEVVLLGLLPALMAATGLALDLRATYLRKRQQPQTASGKVLR